MFRKHGQTARGEAKGEGADDAAGDDDAAGEDNTAGEDDTVTPLPAADQA